MKLALLLLLIASPLMAQSAITPKSAGQLVADWKGRDSTHTFACLYAHRESAHVVVIDSVGPTGSQAEMFCHGGGIVKFTDEKGEEQAVFSAIVAAMDLHPDWIIGSEVYAVLKGNYGPVTEVPLALTVIRKVPSTQ